VVCDAFESETTAFADLVLPDTTYLERHDVMSLLDRPISEFDGPTDSVRVPVLPPSGECRPFQDVLVELGGRLKLPAFTTQAGKPKYRDYADFVINFETEPGSGQGFLIGWRGEGNDHLIGKPNPDQWKRYAENDCVFHYPLEEPLRYMRNWNRGYNDWAQRARMRRHGDPVMIALYSEVMQRFRLAAQGKRRSAGRPPERLRERVEKYFDPLPFFHASLEEQVTDAARYPLRAVTQRPMAMYHSWDSQNAWLRQIHGYNFLFVNGGTAAAQGIADGAWMWVESQWGRVRCMARYSEAVEPGTVWTWNAIGKAPGAWGLARGAPESRLGFILNDLIADELPGEDGKAGLSNSDPVTGQAGWYDVRVRISPA
jgi:sulfite dehydrogenase (quinone) subunit SoeA